MAGKAGTVNMFCAVGLENNGCVFRAVLLERQKVRW